MLEGLTKFFTQTLGLSAEIWLIISVCVVVAAFLATLLVGLLSGRLKVIKGVMKSVIANPSGAVAAMKKMPASIKTQYKNARVEGHKPSMLVTEQVCVSDPYKHSLISKVWLVTLIATFVSAALGEFGSLCAKDATLGGAIIQPLTVWVFGGLLTLIGGIIGKCSYNGAVKTYEKFMPVMDGDQAGGAEAHAAAQQQQPVYAATEPQTAYAEPQTAYVEPQTAYAEPQTTYAEPPVMEAQPVYAEAQPVVEATQESDEEIRRRAREEALAQARAQQQAQRQQQAAQAQAQQQAQAQTQTAAPAGHTSADDVIAQIEKIDRDGAPRETMREVATLLQKERAKPENKTPEQQKKLNEALSKLLKAMSAASRK